MDVPSVLARAYLLIGALGIKDRQMSIVWITAGSGQWPLGVQSCAEDRDRDKVWDRVWILQKLWGWQKAARAPSLNMIKKKEGEEPRCQRRQTWYL